MAYSITDLVAQYNAGSAQMIDRSIIKKNGLISTGGYYTANKSLAHYYSVLSSLPTAGIRSLGDGIAASTVSGSYTTTQLSLFTSWAPFDKAYMGTDPTAFFNRVAPRYLMSVAQKMQAAYIYGTDATFGDTSYTGNDFHSYVSSSRATLRQDLYTGSTCSTGTTIFAVNWSQMPDTDGAAIIVDPLTNGGGVFWTNDFTQEYPVTGATGSFMGHALFVNNDSALILPGAKDVAAITGVGVTGGTSLTQTHIDNMLAAINADSSTMIYCNLRAYNLINACVTRYLANDRQYNNQLATWNGIPIILDDNISNVETAALYGY